MTEELKPIILKLAELVGRDPAEVEAEIQQYIAMGLSPKGAIAKWKSDYRNELAAETFVGRLVAVEEPREVSWTDPSGKERRSVISNLHFLMKNRDGTSYQFVTASLWGEERSGIAKSLKVGEVYTFRARLTTGRGGTPILQRIRAIQPASESEVPEISKLEPVRIDDLPNYAGQNVYIRGWVGRKIYEQATGNLLGFEISDLESLPVVVWVGGNFSRMTEEVLAEAEGVNEGDEVGVFGFVGSRGDLAVNARMVWRFRSEVPS